ncbi:uncharacterized protein DS421_17g596700 [Arachis hypogaea]|nr:uncharacterized protein DS421_17g596700 [Arachis hypogaea]
MSDTITMSDHHHHDGTTRESSQPAAASSIANNNGGSLKGHKSLAASVPRRGKIIEKVFRSMAASDLKD